MFARVVYPEPVETAIAQIESLLSGEAFTPVADRQPISQRAIALLLLQREPALWQIIQQSGQTLALEIAIEQAQGKLNEPLAAAIARARQSQAWDIEKKVLEESDRRRKSFAETLHHLTVHPLTGFPLLGLILYFGIYKFVGEFGAGTLVDFIETFFEERINPIVNQIVAHLVPWPVLQDLVANDYGIVTLGIRYATAIVLPVVATYFLMFSILEDSGYLPRLSLMLDRVLKSIGLSGRAVIPMVLGLGCDTMATMVARTLETRRERLIAVFLLSLAVPCAAQWGVILGLLAQKPAALLFWGGFIVAIFLIMGYLVSRYLPGEQASFYMEIPPLRLPKFKNILMKTWVRMKWYFWEVLPLFIWASVFIWLGRLTGLFELILRAIAPLTRALGLPESVSPIFLYGFFRRDYGAAGLFDLQQQGQLNGHQLVVAAIVLTLFLPCIAQFQMMIKEQGAKTTTMMVAFIFPFAFAMGYLVNLFLTQFGVTF